MISVKLICGTSTRTLQSAVSEAVIAGWTGRDKGALEKHIRELESLGIARPLSTPVYYRVANSRVTTADQIQVSGNDSSGEVEFVVARFDGTFWIGVGSDHTDRKVEAVGVTISKQMCDKPISAQFWSFDEVANHWDQLVLRSYRVDGDGRTLYQEGPVTAIMHPTEIMAQYEKLVDEKLREGCVIFCGTIAAKGGVCPAGRFEFELVDPVLGRKLSHAYDVISLPVRG